MTIQVMIKTMLEEGLYNTCAIFFYTLLFSLPLGILMAVCRMSKIKILSWIMQFIVSVLRGTPLMLQLIAITLGPTIAFGTPIITPIIIPVVISFSINYAAYFSEIFRGGIESIPNGQYEAATILGYSKVQTFIRIILPQVIKTILPSVTNEIVTLVKDTSIAFTVSCVSILTTADRIANSQSTFMPYIIAGVFYYVFNLIVGFIMGKVEKSMNYYSR